MTRSLPILIAEAASGLLLACVVLSGCGSSPCPRRDGPSGFDTDGVLVMAHRGGAGLWPENTLLAFRESVHLGVDVLEMDLRQTWDGALVIIHDATVERTTNGTGRVDRMLLEELLQLDAGYRWTDDGGATFPFRNQGITVPTLEAVLAEFPVVRLNIEIKTGNTVIAEPLCQTIREYQRTEDVLIVANEAEAKGAFRDACPEVATAASEPEVRAFLLSTLLPFGGGCLSPAAAVQVPESAGGIRVVTDAFVHAVHDAHAQIHVWTINKTDEMRRFTELGVDGIITDFPDRLLTLLARSEP